VALDWLVSTAGEVSSSAMAKTLAKRTAANRTFNVRISDLSMEGVPLAEITMIKLHKGLRTIKLRQ